MRAITHHLRYGPLAVLGIYRSTQIAKKKIVSTQIRAFHFVLAFYMLRPLPRISHLVL